MYYKLNNVHVYFINDRNYICIGNVWERDWNWKFVRFVWMQEALSIIDWWIIDPSLKDSFKSKNDKKKEIPHFSWLKEAELF